MPTDGDTSASSPVQPLRLMGVEVAALPPGVTPRAVVAAIKAEDISGRQTWISRHSAGITGQDVDAAQRAISTSLISADRYAPRTMTQRIAGKAVAAAALGAASLANWFWWITVSLLILGLLVGAMIGTRSGGGSWWFGLLMGGAAAAVALRWGLHARKVHAATSRRLA